jgi:hypothetical protein
MIDPGHDEEWEDEDEDGDWNPSVVGPKGVRVMAEQCSTCIFRPGNLMNLNPGRVKDMTDSTDAADGNVTCHQTLGTDAGALCRGSVDRRPGQLARIAQRLGQIEEVTP